jgi:hypothetical protein
MPYFSIRLSSSRIPTVIFSTAHLTIWLGLIFFLILPVIHASAAKPDKAPPSTAPIFTEPRYFYSIDLDPKYQIVGTGELTEEQAAKANCYRFTYETNGKLKEVDYLRAGLPMPDPLFGVASIVIEHSAGVERRWYHDAEGQATKDIDGIAGEELSLNAAGYPTDVTNLDESGGRDRDSSGVIHYVRTLDDHNRLVRGRRIGSFGTAVTDDNGFFETRTVYDDQSRPIERGNYDASGNLLNNNDGVALVRTTYTIYPDAIQTVESYFDSSELPVEEKSSGVHELERVVDKHGLLRSESYYDTTGAPSVDLMGGIHERRYEYDSRGNEISEQFFDTDDKPIDQKSSGFARVLYKYDDKNRVIEKDYYGDDGSPQILLNLGAAIVRQEYDDNGSMVRRQFFDGEGHPIPHKVYLAPAIRIKVEGGTTTIYLRDAHDKPMVNPIQGYASFSYKTDTDRPLSLKNKYYDRQGRLMSFIRIHFINPHLYALAQKPGMQRSARIGTTAAGIGGLIGCYLALRKSSYTRRRKVYVPTPLERFLGWFAVLAILEGSLRFFMTLYWAWVGYQNGRMGHGVYILETIFILFFLYRLYRMFFTMRVLNIERDAIHRLVRDFFAKAGLNPQWIEARETYTTAPLDVRVRFFLQKYHAYLSLYRRHREGRDLARGLDQYIRAHVGGIQAPPLSLIIALYYPIVALAYFLFAGTALYTLWQLVK